MKRSAAGTIPYGSVLLTLVALLLKTSASFRVPAAGSAMIDDDNDGYGSTKASNFIGVTTSSGVNENDIAAGSGDGDEIATPTVSAVVLDEADDKMARDAMIVDSSIDTWANSDDDGGLSVRSTEKTMDDGTRDTIVANQVDQTYSSASASAKDSTAATTTTNRHEQPSTSEASIATTTTTTKTEDEGSTATTAKIKEPAATTAIDASIATTTTTTKTEEPMARTTTEASIATTTQTEEPPATTMTTEEASIAASTTKTEAKAPSATTIATERELASTQRSLDIQTTTASEVAGSSTTFRATAATESTEGGLTGTSTSGRRTTPVVTANSATLETSTMLYRTDDDDDDGKTRSVSSATIRGHPRKGTEASTVAKDSPTSERSVDAAVPVTGNAKYADKPPASYDGDDERAVIADLSRLLSRQVSDVRDFCETGSYAQLAGTLASGLALFVSFVVTMCQLQRLLRNQQQLLRAFETLASGPQRGPKTPFVARGSIVSSSSSSTTTTNQTNNHDDPASIPLLLRSRPRGGDRRLPPSPLFGRRSDRSVAK